MTPTAYDIIPDIHGQHARLEATLGALGYRERGGAWRHDDGGRTALFLGDLIDGTGEDAATLDLVRRMVGEGRARAILGNHELNAVMFHTPHPETGEPLRPHSAKNLRQHASFLRDHPVGSAAASDAIAWMRTLPLFLDLGSFRLVHACWDEGAIARLREATGHGGAGEGTLSEAQFVEAADLDGPLGEDVETVCKGPEHELPDGHAFHDKNGERRTSVRLAWWRPDARTWREAAMSVPDPTELPDAPLPPECASAIYPTNAPPVLFGHYWLTGAPELLAPNAACLDHSAGKGGPLVTYLMEPDALDPARALEPGRLRVDGCEIGA